MNLYLKENDAVLGPYSEAVVRSFINTGRYGMNVLVCPEGQGLWKTFSRVALVGSSAPADRTSRARVFYQGRGVTVTDANFTVEQQTYAMHDITSVKSGRVDPNHGPAIVLLLLGIFLLMIWFSNKEAAVLAILGGLLAVAAIAVLCTLKSRYSVVLTTADGEVRALESTNGPFVDEIVDAVIAAIIAFP